MPQNYSVLDNGGIGNRPGKGKKKQREYVAKYLESKGVKKNPAGSRSKREMRLRTEGRALYQASLKKKSGSSSKTTTTTTPKTTTTTPKKVVTATRPRETGESREQYRNSKVKRSNPLSPAERSSGGLGNSKRERSRGMSSAEARWLDYGPKNRAIVVASNRKSPNRNYKPGKNR